MSQAAQNALYFPPFHIPANVNLLYRDNEIISLEQRAVQVLRYLAEHHERVVSKEEILEAVWPDTFTTDGVLKQAVLQARRALGDNASQARFIKTYHGRGYRFITPVTLVAPDEVGAAGMSRDTADLSTGIEAAMIGVPDYNQLVGREAELALLRAEYQRTLDGVGRPVLLSGDPGVGKTQLAREFGRWAREQGAICLYARFCDYRASRFAPYEVFLELLRDLLNRVGTKKLGRGEGDDQSDLRTLAQVRFGVTLPEELFADAGTGSVPLTEVDSRPIPNVITGPLKIRRRASDIPGSSYRTVIPISQCFVRASCQRPLVLVLDDLQWSDEASHDVIGYLMRTLESEPLMILGIARVEATADPEHPLADWLKRQASHSRYTSLTLKPLDEESSRKMVEAIFDGEEKAPQIPASDLQTLYRVTGGNPYFLTEMLRLLVSEGAISCSQAHQWQWQGMTGLRLPDTIVMAAQAKLDRLSEEVQEIVEYASVLGEEFCVETLARMAEKSEEEIERLLREGVRRGVLSEQGLSTGNDCRFYHTILRHVLYDSLPPRRRKRLHARAIEAIKHRGAEHSSGPLSAYHEAAGDARRAFEFKLRA